jgi:signal peptidase I
MRKLRAALLAVAAALVIRAVFLEPFGVPTGSMAPTILGWHREANCPNCGNLVRVGVDHDESALVNPNVACPNCGSRVLDLAAGQSFSGDRLLVDKSTFVWRKPHRWEIAVFRLPSDPDRPYVKRVVGLPGETLQIVDGDVKIDGALARKSHAQARAVGIPICRMNCRPSEGWETWWAPKANAEPAARVEGSDLLLPFSDDSQWRGLTYRALAGQPLGNQNSYNGRRRDIGLDWVHDFLVSFDFQFQAGDGHFSVSLIDGADEAVATIASDGGVVVAAGESRREARLRQQRTSWRRLSFSFVDRRASLSINDVEIAPPIDLDTPSERAGVIEPLRLRSQRLGVHVRNLRLDRDLHYTAEGRLGSGKCSLAPDEYFMLGDNSGNSEDSRFWPTPGVSRRTLLGKPLLVYAPTRWRTWTALGRSWNVQALDESRYGWIR